MYMYMHRYMYMYLYLYIYIYISAMTEVVYVIQNPPDLHKLFVFSAKII